MSSMLDKIVNDMSSAEATLCNKMVNEYGVSESEVISILQERGVEIQKYFDDSMDANAIAMELLHNKED